MFRRGSSAVSSVPVGTPAEPLSGKGRATPKRSQAQAARRQPLVPDDRKAAAKRAREERRAGQTRTMEAYSTEDQRHLPLRDRGPVRRYVRDLVDRRRNVGQYFLPVAFLVLFLAVVPNEVAVLVSAVAMYTMLGVLVLDCVLLSRTVKKAVAERFGAEAAEERGLGWYAVMRATQMRRMRRPVAKVRHGEAPRP
ncbi:DUF3043 domain-containing protein [Aquipuribacter hungaricus]|uniref:DUF3043 domain-containing protein n=1 Tax=Aquipuribacter hungaricus TaxID=545624 RepID=A0ABV7WHV5_9MICO